MIRRLINRSGELGDPIRIDLEGGEYSEVTDDALEIVEQAAANVASLSAPSALLTAITESAWAPLVEEVSGAFADSVPGGLNTLAANASDSGPGTSGDVRALQRILAEAISIAEEWGAVVLCTEHVVLALLRECCRFANADHRERLAEEAHRRVLSLVCGGVDPRVRIQMLLDSIRDARNGNDAALEVIIKETSGLIAVMAEYCARRNQVPVTSAIELGRRLVKDAIKSFEGKTFREFRGHLHKIIRAGFDL